MIPGWDVETHFLICGTLHKKDSQGHSEAVISDVGYKLQDFINIASEIFRDDENAAASSVNLDYFNANVNMINNHRNNQPDRFGLR